MILGAAVGEHRHGPVALVAGLAISFVAIGMFIATIGYSRGLDAGYCYCLLRVKRSTSGARRSKLALAAKVAAPGEPVGNVTGQTR